MILCTHSGYLLARVRNCPVYHTVFDLTCPKKRTPPIFVFINTFLPVVPFFYRDCERRFFSQKNINLPVSSFRQISQWIRTWYIIYHSQLKSDAVITLTKFETCLGRDLSRLRVETENRSILGRDFVSLTVRIRLGVRLESVGTRSGRGRDAVGTRSGRGRDAVGTRSGRGRDAAGTRPGRGRDAAGTRPGRGRDAAGTRPGRGRDAAGTRSGRGRDAVGTRSGRGRDAVGTRPGRGRDAAGTRPGRGRDAAGTRPGRGRDAAGTRSGRGRDAVGTRSVTLGACVL